QVRLKLPAGSDYGYTGTVLFSQVVVDQGTGTVTLRANFPNPQSMPLPGMYVTAEFAQAIDTAAFLVPQQAVSRDPKAHATLFVGMGAIVSLPLAQYAGVAPTQISGRASYPGASAEPLERSVTQPIEQTLTGLDGLLYFTASSSSRGQVSISAVFDTRVDPDI